MKILFKGDGHYKASKLSLVKEFLAWLNSTVERVRPDLFVSLGDDADSHSVLRSEIVAEVRSHIDRVLSLGVPYVYVIGNHDQWKSRDATYHSMLAMKGISDSFFIVDSPCDLFGMTFVPYQIDPSTFPTITRNICVAHQTFKGADYGSIVAQDGVEPKSINADLIVSGHIHKRQQFDKVIYPGSPYAQDADDIDQLKGLMLLDTDTLKIEFLESPFPRWRRLSAELSDKFSIDDLHSSIESNIAKSKDNWILDLTGPRSEIASYLATKRYRSIVAGASVRVRTFYTDSSKVRVSIKSSSVRDIMSEYFDKVYSGSTDKTKVLTKALEILDKVSAQDSK